jgi:hypothetical protein
VAKTVYSAPGLVEGKMMSDEEVDLLLINLSREGFGMPYMARASDYSDPAELHAADQEAQQLNRDALCRALL